MKAWQRKPLVPCVDCGAPCRGQRCRPCHLVATAAVPRPGLQRSWCERERRARTVREWVEAYGYLCPGWGREPHPAVDLCADHVTPVRQGGPEDGPLTVLCRSCNSRKRDRVVDPRAATRPGGGSRDWSGDRQW
jgi:hypothetical protein